ncbi:hypothetical protein [Saccharicrinis fermentans]|uniref:Uncharacterized protein n=1 Tax=Saccharicrinis fermentans DSM 9555 = JCM 21142 TaxID=869213 RepID=W7Y6S3_9BACT|nr:hypothetical protein [Saccharicrinis fermentans]GAF03952.1 hypothetical protein JCM21142_72642 [Saccharicrinis fermentans DSM 9555 = JCM 21142]
MKTKGNQSKVFILCAVFFVSVSLIAQQNEIKISAQTDDTDSTSTSHYFSTIFDVEDVGKMHEKLDSILSTLDEKLDKSIRVMAFSNDSLFNRFNFDFDGPLDSLFSSFHWGMDENRIQRLLDSYGGKQGRNAWNWDDSYLDSLSREGFDVRIQRDSVYEDGRVVIKNEVIVEGKGEDGESKVIQRFLNQKDNNRSVQDHMHRFGIRHPEEHIAVEENKMRLKTKDEKHRYVEKISISHADILVKGGISPKVITAPALEPKNVEIKIDVKEEFNKKIKTIGMSMQFDDTNDLHVLLLAKDGQRLFEEKLKKFTGTYHKDIEINEAFSPYYFVVIRDKRMFGRLIHQ